MFESGEITIAFRLQGNLSLLANYNIDPFTPRCPDAKMSPAFRANLRADRKSSLNRRGHQQTMNAIDRPKVDLAALAGQLHLHCAGVAMDVLTVLKQDHEFIKVLFSKFESAGKTARDRKTGLFEQIRLELTVHSKAEEKVFYPALKALNGQGRKLVTTAL